MGQGQERRGVWLAVLSVVLFAANVLMVRAVELRVPAANGWTATLIRGFSGLALMGVVFRGRGLEPANLWRKPLVILRGWLGAAGILLFYLTIPELGAGRAVVINLTYPVFGAVFAAIWLRERLEPRQVGWMLLSLAGLAVLLAGDTRTRGIGRWEWVALAGAVVAGGAVVMIRLLRASEHASTIYASQCVWSGLAAMPVALGLTARLPAWAVGVLVVAGILVSAGQIALTESFQVLPVARGSAIQLLLPVLTCAGAWLCLGERFTWVELAGALVAVAATWRAVQRR